MAEKRDILTNIIIMAKSFDETSWIALSNRGLYRRALKDFEKGVRPVIKKEGDKDISFVLNENEINIPSGGFAKAKCSCGITGICHHIIITGLFLSELPVEDTGNGQNENNGKELSEITVSELIKWSGKSNIKKALEMLEKQKKIDIIEKKNLNIKFYDPDYEVIFVKGAGLSGMIISGPADNKKITGAAAVIAYWRSKNIPIPEIDELPEDIKTGINFDPEMVQKIQDLLKEPVSSGLSHLSDIISGQFYSYSILASGANLHRLSTMLRSLGELSDRLYLRNASSSTDEMFLVLSTAFALTLSLSGENPPDYSIGISRSKYQETNEMLLSGIGTEIWQTESGYRGITVYFLERKNNKILSWSDARKTGTGNFNPYEIYESGVIWQSKTNISGLSRSTFTLNNAFVNHAGRISSSEKTLCSEIQKNDYNENSLGDNIIYDWDKLDDKNADNIGLERNNPQNNLVMLKPSYWEKREFDQINQVLYWHLEDINRRFISITIPFNKQNEKLVTHIKNLKNDDFRNRILTARIIRKGKNISLHPISILNPENKFEMINLGIDYTEKKPGNIILRILDDMQTGNIEDYDTDDETEDPVVLINYSGRLISDLELELSDISETGTANLMKAKREKLDMIFSQMENTGLTILSNFLKKANSKPEMDPGDLLLLRYLINLYKQSFSQ